MESSQTLAIESFSCSWLTSGSSLLDGLEELEPPRTSLHTSHEATTYFNFDFPIISQHAEPLVHADQLFSDGLIKPVFIKQLPKMEASKTLDLAATAPPFSSGPVVPTVHIQCHILKRWRKSSGRILHKFSGCLVSLCHRITGSRNSTRVDDIDRKARQVKNRSNMPQASPPLIAYSTNNRCDIENSINDAVLYCKRSIDK